MISLLIFDAFVFGVAFFTADEVKCNFIWCEFTSTYRRIEQNTQCFQNGKQINCTEMEIME